MIEISKKIFDNWVSVSKETFTSEKEAQDRYKQLNNDLTLYKIEIEDIKDNYENAYNNKMEEYLNDVDKIVYSKIQTQENIEINNLLNTIEKTSIKSDKTNYSNEFLRNEFEIDNNKYWIDSCWVDDHFETIIQKNNADYVYTQRYENLDEMKKGHNFLIDKIQNSKNRERFYFTEQREFLINTSKNKDNTFEVTISKKTPDNWISVSKETFKTEKEAQNRYNELYNSLKSCEEKITNFEYQYEEKYNNELTNCLIKVNNTISNKKTQQKQQNKETDIEL